MAGRFWEARPGRIWVGRLETGDDLVEEIERFAEEQEVRAAWVSAIGAVRRAAFAYYEQEERRYLELETSEHHEITSLVGNISILHAHGSFASRNGTAVGGHLLLGCEVFVTEITIRELEGVELLRSPDEVTGLALW
jgi:predicted DNA-binding protein with PD1-like motif